jgi:hypothetical protein
MQFNLQCLLHACFYKLIIFIILSLITHFHKLEFTLIKIIFHVSCKHSYVVHKIIMECGKNNKYPCEFFLTCIVRLLRKVLKIWEKPIISPTSKLKLILCSNKFKVDILSKPLTFNTTRIERLDTMLERSIHKEQSFEARDRMFGQGIKHLFPKGTKTNLTYDLSNTPNTVLGHNITSC